MEFPHLDGHNVFFERKEVTTPGQTILIKGEGMPHHNYPSDRGNLYITFSIDFPAKITQSQAADLQRILGGSAQVVNNAKEEL